MFEKEAEEYLKKDGTKAEQILNILNERFPLKITLNQSHFILAMLKQIFQDGAEFGYNKANEWHYMKDEKMSKFDEGTEIKFLKGKYTKAKRIVFCLCEDNDYQNIYAWKEIVLPELKEDE